MSNKNKTNNKKNESIDFLKTLFVKFNIIVVLSIFTLKWTIFEYNIQWRNLLDIYGDAKIYLKFIYLSMDP